MNGLIRTLKLLILISALWSGISQAQMTCEEVFRTSNEPILRLADFNIRHASKEDVTGIIRFVRGIREQLGVDPDFTADHRPMYKDLGNIRDTYDTERGDFFVLQNDAGEIVGTGGYLSTRKNVCELKKIYLDPSTRGKGTGGAFLKWIIAQATKKGFTKIILQTDPAMASAIDLYKKIGFVQINKVTPGSSAIYFALDVRL
jgi:N-acetylglutamate synthase-like GNAT family acetyltransferase